MSEKRLPLPDNLSKAILEAWGDKCAATGISKTEAKQYNTTLHIDHIEPWIIVKKHEVTNLIPLLARLNLLKGKMEFSAAAKTLFKELALSRAAKVKEIWDRLNHKKIEYDGRLFRGSTNGVWRNADNVAFLANEYRAKGKEGLSEIAEKLNVSIASCRAKLMYEGLYGSS